MNSNESQFSNVSKRERLFRLAIFVLMITSFFLHFCAFTEIILKNMKDQKETKKNNSNKNLEELFTQNILPFICILTNLIWTIVSIVILNQSCLSNNKLIFKLLICTCPLLFCNELNIIFLFHIKFLKNDLLMISIKWLIFFGTISISFWTGILSEKNKWRGIHGGQIAPEHHFPLDIFQN